MVNAKAMLKMKDNVADALRDNDDDDNVDKAMIVVSLKNRTMKMTKEYQDYHLHER